MDLNKSFWTKTDGEEFQQYIKTLCRPEKSQWTKNILNTSMSVLAIPSPEIKDVAKKIAKGNYLSFIELKLNEFYENVALNGFLIDQIKDFDTMKRYLLPYAETADNWSACDLLTFKNIDKNNEKEYWELSLELFKSTKPFVKRIGINIWFKYIEKDEYLSKIFKKINELKDEKEYYVNMVVAWFIAECFIKQRKKTIAFYENNTLCKFAINKSISKCRDSYRVSKEEKQELLKYKK